MSLSRIYIVKSRASAHGRSQLKPQKTGVGPYMKNLLERLNYLLASAHPQLPNLLRRSLYPGCFIKLGMARTQVIITSQLLRIMSEFIIDSAIRGFHVYKSLWMPEIDQELSIVWETSNTHDRFAVTIQKGTLTTGHVPAEISKVCWFFLRRGGTIKCRVSTDRHHRLLLEQGGLEVACKLIFVDDQKLLKKLKKIVLHSYTNNYYNICLGLLRPTQS